MVYLLGIAHSFQERTFRNFRDGGSLDHDPQRSAQFEVYLDNLVSRIKPHIVCEESNESKVQEVRAIDDQSYSIAKKISDEHGIKHMFCDPDRRERCALYAKAATTEIDDATNGYQLREREWLRRIAPFTHCVLLFICGANHVNSFKEKLERDGVTVEVICRDLGEEWDHAENPPCC